ncbi:putative secreted protein [Xanthomonas campestris pv. raphani 756C]|nr:putative secreted protein [Xanthomonas campestris pv. raphani 756C]
MTRCVFACIALLVLACLSTSAHATTSLSFEEGGYSIMFEIGHDTRPVIASFRFNAPGDSEGVWLRDGFQVKMFDTKRRILRLIYTGHDTRVPPFTLVVLANKSTLTVNDKQINSRFSWEM